jgi:ABC-type Fe3+ transport system permease subunit
MGWAGLTGALTGLAGWFDPLDRPGVGLVLALGLVRLPVLSQAVELVAARYHPRWIDAAEVLGASRARATWDLVRPRVLLPLLALFVTGATLSAVDLGAAVLLCPTTRFRPISVAVLGLLDDPEAAGRGQLLAVVGSAGCLLVLLIVGPMWVALFRPRSEG